MSGGRRPVRVAVALVSAFLSGACTEGASPALVTPPSASVFLADPPNPPNRPLKAPPTPPEHAELGPKRWELLSSVHCADPDLEHIVQVSLDTDQLSLFANALACGRRSWEGWYAPETRIWESTPSVEQQCFQEALTEIPAVADCVVWFSWAKR